MNVVCVLIHLGVLKHMELCRLPFYMYDRVPHSLIRLNTDSGKLIVAPDDHGLKNLLRPDAVSQNQHLSNETVGTQEREGNKGMYLFFTSRSLSYVRWTCA